MSNLLKNNKQLMKECNYEKNKDVNLDALTLGSNKIIWWRCSKGHEWETQINQRSRGRGCPYCSNRKVLIGYNDLVTKNPKLALEWNYEKNGNLLPENFSPGSNKKVWWKCSKGHEWEAQINQRSQGTKCAKCLGISKKSDEDFKKEMKEKNPNIELLTKYENARTRIKCKCHICNNEWNVIAYHLSQGQGCPKCATKKKAKEHTLSQEEFIDRMKIINSNIEVIGDYKTSHKNVKVKCKKCSHVWNPKAWDILQGNGCPNCSHTSTSYIEKFIYESFVLKLGKSKVIARDRKTIGKELDIYIPNYNFAIEPGAWYWHKNKTNDDLNKVILCKKKGIRLIIIYDNCPNDNIVNNPNIRCYKCDLSNSRNYSKLKKIVINLFKMIDLKINFTDVEWEKISNKAYLSSRMENTEEFKLKLNQVNKKVDVIGDYMGYKNKVAVKCKRCNYEWMADPGHLLEGKSCPKCIGRYKTHEEFKQQVFAILPDIVLLTKYVDSKTRIDVECKRCGHKWDVKPSNLLSGFGCPKCFRIKQAKIQSKPVCQYTKEGILLKKYKSGKEASEITGLCRSGIVNVCKGHTKTCGGFIWKYADEEK